MTDRLGACREEIEIDYLARKTLPTRTVAGDLDRSRRFVKMIGGSCPDRLLTCEVGLLVNLRIMALRRAG